MADRGLGKPVTGPLQNAAAVQTASGIAGTIGNLERKLKEIEADIRADLQGKQEYENMIDRLKRKKADHEKIIAQKEKYIKEFDADIKPFVQKYQGLVTEINSLYGDAKEKHAKGIILLIEDFAYHPAFKRWSDTFTAIPFKPA